MICLAITRPASSFFVIVLESLMILSAKLLVRCFKSIGFMCRSYKTNRQSPIANRQPLYDFCRAANSLAAAGFSAGIGGVLLVVGDRAAEIDDAIHPVTIASGIDRGRLDQTPKYSR